MVHFVGAGPGAPDLITVRGKELIEKADIIIYAGSLVNPVLLDYAKDDAKIYNSAEMTLEEVTAVYTEAESEEKDVVRLHTGEPSIYGAVKEQMDFLDKEGIPYDSCPGVSACFGAASSLNLEYTLPGVSQTLIITRLEGRTHVPEAESMESLAAHKASMAIYLSAGMLKELSEKLIAGGYEPKTPAAIVYKATWPEEKKIITTVGDLAEAGEKEGIRNIAVVLVGNAVSAKDYDKSRLYAADFTTGFRTAKQD
jgi:precorrin-4/cobalt-precorrin-4 C11-methyltransferase